MLTLDQLSAAFPRRRAPAYRAFPVRCRAGHNHFVVRRATTHREQAILKKIGKDTTAGVALTFRDGATIEDVRDARQRLAAVIRRVRSEYRAAAELDRLRPEFIVSAANLPKKIRESGDVRWQRVPIARDSGFLHTICGVCTQRLAMNHDPTGPLRHPPNVELEKHHIVCGGNKAAFWWGRCTDCGNVTWGTHDG